MIIFIILELLVVCFLLWSIGSFCIDILNEIKEIKEIVDGIETNTFGRDN